VFLSKKRAKQKKLGDRRLNKKLPRARMRCIPAFNEDCIEDAVKNKLNMD